MGSKVGTDLLAQGDKANDNDSEIMQMRVHRNLHNARRGGPQWVHTVKGRVSAYLDEVQLANVTTRIQPAGAAKCAATQVRSVCAFFDGEETHISPPLIQRGWEPVCYDPRADDAFHTPEGVKWNAAEYVVLASDGRAWAYNPRWQS